MTLSTTWTAATFALLAATAQAQTGGDYDRYHPDVVQREAGLDAFEVRDYTAARAAFLAAARFADKGAQAMLAEMAWQGLGTARDPVAAYIWADLAAERGYALLVAKREHYWTQLDDTQRARAVADGQAVYADYGDAAAQPRLDAMLRQGQRMATGSRVGVGVSGVQVYLNPTRNGFTQGMSFHGSRVHNYYAPQRWDTNAYWQHQDATWRAALPPRGSVDVGPLAAPDEAKRAD